MHGHADEHDHSAGFEHGFCGEHVEDCQNKDQCDTRQFPEEFCHTPVHFAHAYHFRQEVVQHTFIKTVGQAGDQNTH